MPLPLTWATPPSRAEIESGILQRVRTYSGLEFSIISSFNCENKEDKTTESVELAHEIFRLHFPEKGQAWKYWIQKIQDEYDQEWIINRFHITNVAETRIFIHTLEAEGKWNNGSIIPWYTWDEQEGRSFATFLSMNTAGLSLLAFEFSETLKKQILSKELNFVGYGEIDGIKTLIFQNYDKEIGDEYEMHVTESHFLVVYSVAKNNKENFSLVYRVEKLGFFEGICYPQKGYLHQTAKKYIDKVDYKFEVTNVRRFDISLLNSWFPDWPSATIVADVKTNKNITIPHSERQIKKILDKDFSKVELVTQSTWTPFRIFLIFINSMLTIILIVWIIIKWQYRNKTRN
jgi:hypothetical protein